MFFVRLFLLMVTLGAGRNALLAQQHGEYDFMAMVVALLACCALLVLRPRGRLG